MPTHLGELDAAPGAGRHHRRPLRSPRHRRQQRRQRADAAARRVHARGVGEVVRREPPRPRVPRPGGAAATSKESPYGAVVNVISAGAFLASTNVPMYSAAKAGMHAFTRAMAREWAPFGIRVNALAPGTVDTDMVRNNPPEAQESMANAAPMRARRARRRDGRPRAAARVRRRELHHRRSPGCRRRPRDALTPRTPPFRPRRTTVPVPLDEYPRPPGAAVDALHGVERSQLLRPLVLERAGPHRRGVPRDRPRRVPEPRRDRRVRDHRHPRPPGGGAHVRRAGRRPPGPGGRPVQDRGDRAAARSCASRATPRSRASPSTSRGTRRSPRTRSLGTRPASGNAIILDAARFAQVGTWEGWMKVDDQEWEVSPDTWVGARDRSWGIRPVGEQPGPGRPDETPGGRSFWWLYTPTRFDDFFLFVIAQEDGDGNRGINEAVRMWPDGRIEQLGWPEVEITYRSGHASSGTRGDAPPRREPQAVRRRVRDARVRRDRARRGLRRRRLDPRPLDGQGMGRPGELRPHRSRGARPHPVRDARPRRQGHVQRRRGLRPVRAHQRRPSRAERLRRLSDPSDAP